MKPLEALAKWRRVFMHWQLGARDKGDPEADAVVNHIEMSILMRTELNAFCALMIQKGVFTALEFTAQCEVEAEYLTKAYEQKFPGFSTDETGVTLTAPAALATMERIGFARITQPR